MRSEERKRKNWISERKKESKEGAKDRAVVT